MSDHNASAAAAADAPAVPMAAGMVPLTGGTLNLATGVGGLEVTSGNGMGLFSTGGAGGASRLRRGIPERANPRRTA